MLRTRRAIKFASNIRKLLELENPIRFAMSFAFPGRSEMARTISNSDSEKKVALSEIGISNSCGRKSGAFIGWRFLSGERLGITANLKKRSLAATQKTDFSSCNSD